MAHKDITVDVKLPAVTLTVEQVRAALLSMLTEPAEAEPVSINAPDGIRFLWLDETGESHWLRSGGFDRAAGWGWRQAYVLKASVTAPNRCDSCPGTCQSRLDCIGQSVRTPGQQP